MISIIAIIAAILFPVFARARENARRTSCASNMKQLALCVMMYSQDYDGRLSSLGVAYPGKPLFWAKEGDYQSYGAYIKNDQILFCPSAPLYKSKNMTSWMAGNYGLNSNYTGSSNWLTPIVAIKAEFASSSYTSGMLVDALPEPSRTCLLGETRNTTGYASNGNGASFFEEMKVYEMYLNNNRHLEGANYAYVDGHVKWIKKETEDAVVAQQRTGGGWGKGMRKADGENFPIVFVWHKADFMS